MDGTPIWSHDGIICTGESHKSVVKLTFAKGVSLKDLARLFNSSLDGNYGARSTSTKESRVRLQKLNSGHRPQQFRQVEIYEESES